MPIFCNTQTTVERQYLSAMKKRITWNSAQTWATKIVKNHVGIYCICSRAAICLPHKTWERMLHHRPVYWDDCGVVWILRTTWCSRRAACHKEQHREFALIVDEVATRVSEHSVQKTSVAAFISKYSWYTVYRQNFSNVILW